MPLGVIESRLTMLMLWREPMPGSNDHAQPGLSEVLGRVLAHCREWWQRSQELRNLDAGELDRVAGELGLTAKELAGIAARGASAADLLYRRMEGLGLSRTQIACAARGLMRDLERTCAGCAEKRVCKQDLARRPDSPAWMEYCPNAESLQSAMDSKGSFAA